MTKKAKHISLSLILLIVVACKASSPYDNSTPEKFIASLGQISIQPKEQNPIPFFYVKEDAIAVTRFDDEGQRCIDAFDTFKAALRQNFLSKVKEETADEIKLQTQDSFLSTLAFSLRVSLIRTQLQERGPDDYQFVSSSVPNEEGIVNITYRMLGNERQVEVKEEDGKYLMFLRKESTSQLSKMVDFFLESQDLFSRATKDIEEQKLNKENFETVVTDWHSTYSALLERLN